MHELVPARVRPAAGAALLLGVAGVWTAGQKAEGLTRSLVVCAATAALLKLLVLITDARRTPAARAHAGRRPPLVLLAAAVVGVPTVLWAASDAGLFPAALAVVSGACCSFGLFALLVLVVPPWRRRLAGDGHS